MFEQILLEPEQQELLSAMVMATRALPREQRVEFMLGTTFGGTTLQHPGLPDGALEKRYMPDFKVLAKEGLLELRPMSNSPDDYFVFVTPRGMKYHDHISSGAPDVPQPTTPSSSSIAVNTVGSDGGAISVGGNVYDNRTTTIIQAYAPSASVPMVDYSELGSVDDLLLQLLTQEVQTHTSFRAMVPVKRLMELAQAEGVPADLVEESLLATLEPHYVVLTHYLGPPFPYQHVSLTSRGVQYGLRQMLSNYDALVLNVATQVAANPNTTSRELAQASDSSDMFIAHALQVLHDKGFIHVGEGTGSNPEMGSLIRVGTVFAKLSKFLRNPKPEGLTL